MVEFFKKKSENDKEYLNRYEAINKRKDVLRYFEHFQFFNLSDLIDLLHHHELKGKDGTKIKVDKKINDNLRNCVMHSRNTIKLKDYEESVLIYNFDSFEEMFNLVLTLYEEKEKVDELNA